MTLLIILGIALFIYFVWTYFQEPLRSLLRFLPFFQNPSSKALKSRILLLLRGNEAAFQRMYERESALYPDLKEKEILERILAKIESDR